MHGDEIMRGEIMRGGGNVRAAIAGEEAFRRVVADGAFG